MANHRLSDEQINAELFSFGDGEMLPGVSGDDSVADINYV